MGSGLLISHPAADQLNWLMVSNNAAIESTQPPSPGFRGSTVK